jgi:chemotaxis protein methyltransferase CheR
LLKRRIFVDRGFDCDQYKENYLKRRFAVRLRATGTPDYAQYLQVLKKDPDEYTALLNELTVNVTQFFRDQDVFKKMRELVIPGILKNKAHISARTIRVWSAGCSSGEEPYSLAILINEVLGAEAKKWTIRILGSDYDDKSLKVARVGVYQDLELPKGINPSAYFLVSRTESGLEYRVREDIKTQVRFEKKNLLEHEARRHYDLVVCRNVLIYFSREVQVKIIEALAASILGAGYLVLGKSETLGPEVSGLLKPVAPVERVYRLNVDAKVGGRGGRNG